MAKLTKAELGALVLEALQEYFPYEGGGTDTRTLRELRNLFEQRHLGGFLRQFQATKAARVRKEIDPKDLD